ncbi:MAG: GNAT family N-acetyltransferase [Alphaproteobacteria bacterium]|uniref:GNAT family N-acetyltransferase n=1 Tax=Pyruvatibacter sp. HU-CL02332 TaxID=3127650 RepID=UPI0029683092|nr:GNAT family N-acetyltransferase [Alphaproteobacteria bacterium]
MLDVPVLETERMTLVPLGDDHRDGVRALWSQPAVVRHSGRVLDAFGIPIMMPMTSLDDADRLIAFWRKAQADDWGCRWAMLLGAAQAFAGMVGFNALRPAAEIAYHLHPDYWGQGLMLEACEAALDWRLADKDVARIDAFVEPVNGRSIALAKRLGMTATGDMSEGAERYSREVGA